MSENNQTISEISTYEKWEKLGLFEPNPSSQSTPFTIMMPPPNVTGSLHLGHALTMTLQDVLIRYKRMQGFDTLWQPGTDHAGIATQLVVERLLAKENTNRKVMGRDKFLERVWEWKEESGGNITKQLRRLGASVAWRRERFTMDEGLSKAVAKAFVELYKNGLIYKDKRLVNWDPKFQSAISDLEVINKETKGSLWYIKYPIAGENDKYITVATTRPETMLGDTAVAVNPEDERYKHFIGKQAIIPIVGIKIPIVADEHSDPTKGSGAVKITPAHDFNDFEVGKRHNLTAPSILDEEARITIAEINEAIDYTSQVSSKETIEAVNGQDRFVARKIIVAELERLGILEKIEPHISQIPYAERGDAIVEPRLTCQWFCNAAELAKPAIKAVEDGRIEFVPKQWENTYFAWMSDLKPWCISRQLWWGHRIPAWYAEDGTTFVAESYEAAAAQAEKKFGQKTTLTQDNDVLDTWFSSALWPFSTLGWPEKTPELNRYYPTDVLVTGFDIIFFWVSRMMMMGMYFMNDVPFKKIFIHGLVRDEKGQKMSKTKGNVINPLEVMDKLGTDALRYTICNLAGPGRNLNLGMNLVEQDSHFITKLNSAFRFCEMSGIKYDPNFDPSKVESPICLWLLNKLNDVIEQCTNHIERFRIDEYTDCASKFVWNTFCDWYIELIKPELSSAQASEIKATAAYTLRTMLKLLHPAIPYTTQNLWVAQNYNADEELIKAAWPKKMKLNNIDTTYEVEWTIKAITAVRALRSDLNIAYKIPLNIEVHDATPKAKAIITKWENIIKSITKSAAIGESSSPAIKESVRLILDGTTFVIPLKGVIDTEAEKARIGKEIEKSRANIAKLEGQLNNENFVKNAPEEVVNGIRDTLKDNQAKLGKLDEIMNIIG